MQITIQLPEEISHVLSTRSPPTARSASFLNILTNFGLTAEPLHADTDDPSLRSYLTVQVQDEPTAQRVIDHLQSAGVVDAAYIKPPDALP